MMADIPIIFSPPMIRALLREVERPGTGKTMTRRLLKPQPDVFVIGDKPAPVEAVSVEGERPRVAIGRVITTQPVRFAPGDRLWVKENHAFVGGGDPGLLLCEADWRETARQHHCENADAPPKWTPSIHMTRRASRLTLRVTAVKIERLQDISREDAIAEGATAKPKCSGFNDAYDGWSMNWREPHRDHSLDTPQLAFASFINQLHGGPRWNCKPTSLWGENPYVVAVSFDVIKANIDALPKWLAA